MSGTLTSIYNNVSYALGLHTAEMSRLQEQVATGSKVNRASDDSSAAYQILGLNSKQSSLKNYIDNISNVVNSLGYSSTIVQNMMSAVSETMTQLTQVTSGVYNEEDRARVAESVNEILEQLVSLANSEHSGQHLFGGSNTASEPYLIERTNGRITNVTYQGGYNSRKIEVASGLESVISLIGDDIFRCDDRGEVVFLGDTGAKAGTGTSSLRGYAWLTVTGSAGNYTLSIDGGLSTFSTDGTDTNLAVTNSITGQVLYIDTTEITDTGTDLVSVSGTYDIFNVLISIRDILSNNRALPEDQVEDMLENSLGVLEDVNDLLAQTEVSLGYKINFLDNLGDNLTDLKYDADDEVTRLQEADVTQLAIDLARLEILYQMSLSVAGQLMSMSLLDYVG
ncbi:MAG: flagellar hook-associated protein FlgL [Sedimentisphaerales bacterium]|nr:flagellar hook-associated protein FlgL [Sedimentisphaerales bacterium]